MAKAQLQVKGKLQKKSWHPIIATKAFDSAPLGETYVAEPSAMADMRLSVNLANLTGDIRQQGVSLKFRVLGVDKGSGIAGVVGYDTSQSQLRRLVRRGVERLDDSIQCSTSDGKTVKIKPFAVTKAGTGKTKLSLVRKKLRETITNHAARQTFDELIKDIISHKLQSSLKNDSRNIFPLRFVEIRKLELVSAENTSKDAETEKPKEIAAAATGKKTEKEKEETKETEQNTVTGKEKKEVSEAEKEEAGKTQ